ncbi:MAG: ABC transporter ATP-binding protein [Actinomycetaceae bacterium]|nr:ABC transporter ATP-binding protein [Arcanobacterium sp.]MDD7505182.1 ABC transporter ATP-binding protein [Actinomycetaceae bacterium]MDY6144083.1 ABC transporter ATP-binding protein [Arcanobacterium sp.]
MTTTPIEQNPLYVNADPSARPPVSGAMIELIDVTKTHRNGSEVIHALDHVTTSIAKGEFVAVMGPSGSGKSTLLNIVGGLDSPDSGIVNIAGRNIAALSIAERAKIRRTSIGYVFQDYNLIPTLTLAENVALPLELDGVKEQEARKIALESLASVELSDAADRFPAEVSRGQAQRAAIARACIGEDRILLADEPTGALDSNLSEGVMRILRSKAEAGSTVLLVTHEARFAGWADRVIYLRDGKIDPQHTEGV